MSDEPTTTRAEGAPRRDRMAEYARLERGLHTPLARAKALKMNLADYLAWVYPGYRPNPIALPPESTGRNLKRRAH